MKYYHEPMTYQTGEPHGYLFGVEDHPLNVEVEVLENRYFNGPDGSHFGPGSRAWRAEIEIEPNRAIFLPVTSPEFAAYQQRQAAKRKAAKSKANPSHEQKV